MSVARCPGECSWRAGCSSGSTFWSKSSVRQVFLGDLPPGFRVDIVVINAVASRQGGQLKVGLLRDLITFCCDKCPPIKTIHITYILTIDMQTTAQYVKNISL